MAGNVFRINRVEGKYVRLRLLRHAAAAPRSLSLEIVSINLDVTGCRYAWLCRAREVSPRLHGFHGQMAVLLLVMRELFDTTPYVEVVTLGQDQELMLKPTVMA